MANQPNRGRNRISLPGHRSGMRSDELKNALFGKAPSSSSVAPEYIMNEVKPVQECGHSESANINITKPESDVSHNLSPVSEYGQKGRNHYKSSGSNQVSDETCQSSVYQSENACDYKQQDLDTAKGYESGRNEEESYSRISTSSSYIISSSAISHFQDSYKDLLNSSILVKSGRDSIKNNEKLGDFINSLHNKLTNPNQEGSETLEELITSIQQTKPSFQNQEDNEFDIKHMLLSLLGKVSKHYDCDMTDVSIPSLRSYILMWSSGLNKEKNSLDPMSGQMPPPVPTDNEMINILRAECREPLCSKSLCRKVQQSFTRLQDNDVLVTDLTLDEQRVLSCMCDHCYSCKYLHCPLYWCQKEALCSFNRLTDQKEILAKMKQLAEHGYHPNFLEDLRNGSFVKFFHSLPWNDIPREPDEWGGLYRLPRANNTIFAQFAAEEGMKYWIIKKCRMYKSLSQMDLYETLREISHNGIALHLWTQFCPDIRYMAVCVEYEVFSLYELLQESPLKNLHVVVRIMLQLIRTTRFLHEKGILYLNWSSRNIVYSTTDYFKLTNFTCSALKTTINEDIKDISLSLPRHLITPEMLETNPEVDEMTDVWGLGCLLKEILSGQPMWSEYLHEPTSVLEKKILMEPPPQPHDCLELFTVFKACWERQRSLRPSLDELGESLVQAKDRKMCR